MSEIKQGWRPKDGPGPRGVPDCYYTSRVLNSTLRYVSFVNRLRHTEKKEREGNEHKLQARKLNQSSEFCIRSDRKNCINAVARKVDLCLESYEDDLKEKRIRLRALLNSEEEANTRKFVEQAQAGAELVLKDKEERLKFLLAKRKKEQDDKFKDTPLSKCAHITSCIFKQRVYDEKAIQLYQIREKQARKMQEMELDKMWHEVAMKESEALAARQEYDAMERYRRDMECKEYTDWQVADQKRRREEEKQQLIQETIRMRERYDEEERIAIEKEQKVEAKRYAVGRERMESIKEREVILARQKEDEKLIQDTFDSLKDQSNEQIRQEIELRKRKEREVVECNKRMVQLKAEQQKHRDATDDFQKIVEQQMRVEQDERRCIYERKRMAMTKEARDGIKQQIEEHKQFDGGREQSLDQQKYNEELNQQMNQLAAFKQLTDAQRRKKHQQDILDQIGYQKLLQERAEKEEQEQIAKYKRAEEQYRQEVADMMNRQFFSDEVHHFTKQVANGLKMANKCPCTKTKDYCAN